jgi:hypothetical protein
MIVAEESDGASGEGPGAEGGGVPDGRLQANKNRALQVARTGGRKLFDEEAKAVFHEWFGATCNLALSAEQAGFNRSTIARHYLADPAFAARMDEAIRLSVVRLKAKSLESKGPPVMGPEGELDAPDLDDIGREEAMRLVREHERTLHFGRKQGRTPRVASNAEVEAALVKRLAAFGKRVIERDAVLRDSGSTGSPLPQDERKVAGAPAAGQPAPPPPPDGGGSPPRSGEE